MSATAYTPAITHPAPPSQQPRQHQMTIPVGGEDYLGLASLQFRNAQFIAEKSFEVPNAADVIVKLVDDNGNFVDSKTITPGVAYNWPAPSNDGQAFFTGQSFRVSGTATDGIRLIYT